jgi:toxin CcdB
MPSMRIISAWNTIRNNISHQQLMAQFDVYENGDQQSRHSEPYVMDVQSNLLNGLATRMVIPLVSKETIGQPVDILNPVVRIANQNFYLSSPQLRSVHKDRLGNKIATIVNQRDAVRASVAFLLSGNYPDSVI